VCRIGEISTRSTRPTLCVKTQFPDALRRNKSHHISIDPDPAQAKRVASDLDPMRRKPKEAT
jgi:hypothetical protein